MVTRVPAFVLAAALLPVASTAQGLIPFGPEFQVNTYTTGTQIYPAASFGPDGTFIVVWDTTGLNPDAGIFGQRYDAAGTPTGPEFRVNALTGFNYQPDVVTDGEGRFTVVWSTGDIFARRFDASGDPLDGVEYRVNTYTTGRQSEPSIASDAAGGTVIVWDGAGEGGGPAGVSGRRYDAAGNARGDQFQIQGPSMDFPFHHPAVASDAAGNFIATWNRFADALARRFGSSGLPEGSAFPLNGSPANGYEATVAAEPAGSFVVVWESRLCCGEYHVAAQRFDPSGVRLGPELYVNTVTTSRAFLHPEVASDPQGRFTVVWQRRTTRSDIAAQHYDAAGNPVGGEFQVNLNLTHYHNMPSVASGAEGDVLVTWSTWNKEDSSTDVFARLYRTDLIFADGFESGSLGAWSSSATGGGDLTVSPDAAAKLTTNGLRGAVDGTAPLYVQDASPRDEPRYRARFHFDTNNFDPGEADSHLRTRIFIAFEEAPTRRLAAIVLRRQSGAYSLIGRARLDDHSQADTAPFPIGDGAHYVEIDWRRSSGPDADDGAFEMWIDGTLAATLPTLDNSLSAVDFVRLGALSVKSGASGTMDWDEFESRRGSYIGP